jgi:uncharacterized membrane protein YeaQ/YmgE (transglycosylase-associated protein family)
MQANFIIWLIVGGLFVSLVGAVILLAIVNLLRRGKAR